MKRNLDSLLLPTPVFHRCSVSRAVRQVLAVGSVTVGLSMPLSAAGFPASIELSELDGSDGFVINGVSGFTRLGYSVSGAGDVNGDGVADFLIGANRANPNGNDDSGQSYVVFGGSGVGTGGSVELSDLDGSDGFVLNGVDMDDRSGSSVSGAGDVNGDGMADLLLSLIHISEPTRPY